jgi:hypothetical protein
MSYYPSNPSATETDRKIQHCATPKEAADALEGHDLIMAVDALSRKFGIKTNSKKMHALVTRKP